MLGAYGCDGAVFVTHEVDGLGQLVSLVKEIAKLLVHGESSGALLWESTVWCGLLCCSV